MAHEHQRRLHGQGLFRRGRAHHQVRAQGWGQGALGPREGKVAGGNIQPKPREAHRLPVAGAMGGLKAQHLQLGLQVAHRQVPAPLSCAPAFQHIIRQEREVGPEGRLVHPRSLGRQGKAGENGTEQGSHGSLRRSSHCAAYFG